MKRDLVLAAALLILAGGCTAESDPEPKMPATPRAPAATPAPKEIRPGDPAVYQKIEASTDCAELQQIFDTAADGPARPWKIPYMNAADARLREVGCY